MLSTPESQARRRPRGFSCLQLVPLLAALLVHGARTEAQDSTSTDFESKLTDAMVDMEKGSFNAAISQLQKLLTEKPSHAGARIELGKALKAVGHYDEADRECAEALRLAPGDASARHLAIELAFTRGRFEEVEKSASQALEVSPKDLHALRYRGLAALEQGKRNEAEKDFRAIAELAKAQVYSEAPDLCDVAVAFWHLGGDQEVVDALDEAKSADPQHSETYLLLGDFLLERYEDTQAITEYRKLLEKHPGSADAHAGLIDCYAYRGNPFLAEEECDAALAINSNHVGALQARALGLLEDLKYAEAKAAIDKALAVNPRSKRTRAALAAHHYLLNERAGYEAECARVLAQDPHWGEVHYVVGESLAARMRFQEALALCRKAVEVDPKLWKAWVSVGKYSFHTGDEESGVQALKKAQEGDPWEFPWRENMLTLAEYLDEFVTISTPHFLIRLHVEEKGVLEEYLPALLEESWDVLTKRYGFEPKTPVLVEVFPEQKDFAVRTIGMEGISGILGACFGAVITLDSPRAFRDPKTGKPIPPPFSWARTTWHEFAHVVALQMSKSRVPRWLTEGLSTWEEKRSRFDWDREMDFDLFLAEANGKIIPLAELNAAFRTNRIGFAYYQGGLICEFIETTFGFDKILKMLRLYGEDKQTPEIVKDTLSLTPEEFDRRFLEFVRGKTSIVHAFPVYDPDVVVRLRAEAEAKPNDVEILLKLAWGYFWLKKPTDCGEYLDRALRLAADHPSAWALRGYIAFNDGSLDKAEEFLKKAEAKGARDFILHQKLAQIAKRAGRVDEAIAEYQASKADFPRFVGQGNPYTELDALYRGKERNADAQKELEAYVEIAHNDMAVRRFLADAYGEQKDWAKQLKYLEQILWVNPFDADLHVDLARTYRSLGQLEAACRELRVAIALKERDETADLHADLAELYRERGMEEQARAEAEEALRIRPDHEKATKFLERRP